MTLDDFKCPCCGINKTTVGFFYKLKWASDTAGVKFIPTSGYRCEEHNKAVGGSETSTHRKGEAADILVGDSSKRFKIISALMKVGIDRIGIGDKYIHADDDKQKPRGLIWIY
jgi:uncharacterized protein YcbK (DUF882 family)